MADRPSLVGQTISHYRILEKLGSGGMGVVYKAEDTRLQRLVALKFLPDDVANDPHALARFQREAQAASALNNPHICTIYDIGEGGGRAFIAMEYLEGETLKHLIQHQSLTTDQILDLAGQIADGLDAAHGKGIIHRDLKPPNIFVTATGQAKILDFGLAKVASRKIVGSPEMTAATADASNEELTSPGAAVGTVAYMSPEQVRGEKLDSRSDLFSLGVVLYEMATGRLAFPGNTPWAIFHGILNHAPASPVHLNPDLPARLEEIINKALEKDMSVRYQHGADIRSDLKRLRRDLDSGKLSASNRSQIAGAQLSQSRPKQFNVTTLVASATSLLLMVALGYGLYSRYFVKASEAWFQEYAISKVTETGDLVTSAISADGKYIASVVKHNGTESLSLRNVSTQSDTQVLPPSSFSYDSVQFSPDGNYLYFLRGDANQLGDLYRVPVLGGTPQLISEGTPSAVTFSPDAKKIAFVGSLMLFDPKLKVFVPSRSLLVSDVLGREKKGLLAFDPKAMILQDRPAWSPDGKVILLVVPSEHATVSSVVSIEAGSGKQRAILSSPDRRFRQPCWLPDGRGFLLQYSDKTRHPSTQQIAYVSYPDGQFREVTRDTNNYSGLSLSADGKLLATVQTEDNFKLYTMETKDKDDAHATSLPAKGVPDFTWLADGTVVVAQSGKIVRVNDHGGDNSILLADDRFAPFWLEACDQSKYIVFMSASSEERGSTNLWRFDTRSGEVEQLTHGQFDASPACSPDGGRVYYAQPNDDPKIQRIPTVGGSAETIFSGELLPGLDVSRDGKLVVATVFEDDMKFAVLDADSGKLFRKLAVDPRVANGGGQSPRFTPDGNAVAYGVRVNGVDNLWGLPLDGSKAHPITNFRSEEIRAFRWSPDGKKLAFLRGHQESDVVLIRDAHQSRSHPE